jgi:hypothetical protein
MWMWQQTEKFLDKQENQTVIIQPTISQFPD